MAYDQVIQSKWFPPWSKCHHCSQHAEYEVRWKREVWQGHRKPPKVTAIKRKVCPVHVQDWADQWGIPVPPYNEDTRRE